MGWINYILLDLMLIGVVLAIIGGYAWKNVGWIPWWATDGGVELMVTGGVVAILAGIGFVVYESVRSRDFS